MVIAFGHSRELSSLYLTPLFTAGYSTPLRTSPTPLPPFSHYLQSGERNRLPPPPLLLLLLSGTFFFCFLSQCVFLFFSSLRFFSNVLVECWMCHCCFCIRGGNVCRSYRDLCESIGDFCRF